MIQYWIILIYFLLLFVMIIFRNSIQDGTKFYYLCQKFEPMISWKFFTNWESAQHKTVLELYDMEIHHKRTLHWMMRKLRMISGVLQEISFVIKTVLELYDMDVDHEYTNTAAAELCGWTAKTADIGIAIRQILSSTLISGFGFTIQKPSYYLFWFSIGGCDQDQRSGDGLFIGWSLTLTSNCLKECSKFWNAGREDWFCFWTRSTRIPTSRRRSVSRSRKPRKRIGFWEGVRSPSWSTTTFEWLALTIPYWITVIYPQLLFMTTMFRNSMQDGAKFCCLSQRFHPMISWKVCTNWGYVCLINSKPCWNCTTWTFIRRYRLPIIRNWRQWWRGTRTHNRHTFRANRITRSKCVEEEKHSRQKLPWVHSSTTVLIFFAGYLHANALSVLASTRVRIFQSINGL